MKRIPLLLVMVCFFACKPKIEPHITISDELKQYYNYKPGSYWIYRDSISNLYDSFFVLDNVYTASLEHYTSTQEDISISIGEQNAVSTGSWTMELYSNDIDLLDIQKLQNGYDKEIRYSLFTSLPYQLGNLRANGEDTGAITHFFTVYGLSSGLAFNNVGEIHHTGVGNYLRTDTIKGNINFKYNNWFYVNDSVGIIKMRLMEDTIQRVWEIQRWNIVR